MARVEVTPEQFTLVQYDAAVIAGLAEELATEVGLPDDVPIHIEVDEELPLPLTGSTADGQVYPRLGGPFGINGGFWYVRLRIKY